MFLNAPNSFIHNHFNLQTTQLFRNRWMDKQIIVVYSYHEILLQNKKDWITDTQWRILKYNDLRRKKVATKEYTLCNFIYIES